MQGIRKQCPFSLGHMVGSGLHSDGEQTYCVFHMFCAALTFLRAVSSVNGGLMSAIFRFAADLENLGNCSSVKYRERDSCAINAFPAIGC